MPPNTTKPSANAAINKLRELRTAAGLTQSALAEASGIPISNIQRFEYGERNIENITLKNAAALAAALKIEIGELLDDAKPPNTTKPRARAKPRTAGTAASSAAPNKLRELRAASGLAQSALAEAAGISLNSIQCFEYGERRIENMRLKNAVLIAAALGVAPQDLLP